MSYRNDRYIDGEHFWIRYYCGTHEVRRETYASCSDNETVFTGSYEKCCAWLDKAEAEADYYDSLF